jgi:hypothetical protein
MERPGWLVSALVRRVSPAIAAVDLGGDRLSAAAFATKSVCASHRPIRNLVS